MLRIMKNSWYLLMNEKNYLIVSIIMTICSVGAAVLITNQVEMKSNIAVIANEEMGNNLSSRYYHINFLEKEPPRSELIQHRYDAVVIMGNNDTYKIITTKNDEYKNELQRFLDNPSDYSFTDFTARQIGTNILGYMMMFLFMQGVLFARFFAEDKEKHRLERISMSPLPFCSYLLGHGAFIWLLIFLPSFSVIAILKLIGISVGLSILQYILLIGILCLFAVAFALFVTSFFCVADTANMIASSVIVLTSILAGSFYSFTKKDSFFNKLLHIFPQKDFINFSDALEKGAVTTKIGLQLAYVIVLSLVLFTFAVLKTKRDYVYKK